MDKIGSNLLFTTKFQSIQNWSVKYLSSAEPIYKEGYKMVSIGDFLTRNKTPIEIEDEVFYKRVTIKINNGGISLRDTIKGQEIGTKNQFVVSEGQFLMSKIDARNGAFGVVPKSLNGAVITGNFWTFDVDYSKINPHFLTLTTTTPEFIRFSQNASNGTTNRHYLQENLFLAQKIPLPDLVRQNLIVNSYNKKIQLSLSQEEKIIRLNAEKDNYFMTVLGIEKQEATILKKGINFINFSKLSKWALSHNLKDNLYDFEKCKYVTKSIKSLLTFFEGGKTPSKSREDFWNGDVFWTSPKDFSGLSIDNAEDRITNQAVDEAKMKIFPIGTFLSVFRSGILRHSFPTAITTIKTTINQDVKAYSLNEEIINKFYYLYFVHTFKDYILEKASKKSVTVESINTEDFFELTIPIPPMSLQNEIVDNINRINMIILKTRTEADYHRATSMKEFQNEIFHI